MKEMYAWVPWFNGLSKRIAENDSSYLVERAKAIPLPRNEDGESKLVSYGDENIDPFSFIYTVASYLGGKKPHELHDVVREQFNLPEKLPIDAADALIFPQGSAINLLFHDGVAFAPRLLNELFRSVVAGKEYVDREKFKSALDINGVAATKLTQALFLINPHEFLPFDTTSVKLLGGAWKTKNRISWDNYLDFLESATRKFPGCSLYEINALAYLTNRNKDKLQISPSRSWLISAGGNAQGGELWQQFDEESSVFVNEPREGVAWREFNSNEHELEYPLKDPSSGDIVYVREGTVGQGIGVVYKNDYVDTLHEDSHIHVLWLCKEDQEISAEGIGSHLLENAEQSVNHFRSAYPTTHSFLDRFKTTAPVEKRTWLLLWNPKKWKWDSFDEDRLSVLNGGIIRDSWSCSNTAAKTGDRVFLMRLGEEPKGIIAVGSVVKDSYIAPHFSNDQEVLGKTQRTVDVEFSQILDPRKGDPYISLDDLKTMGEGNQNWTPQQSGIEIDPKVAIALAKVWESLFKPLTKESSQSLNTILYGPPGTGKTYLTMTKSVEICDDRTHEEDELRVRYAELVDSGRITFVTFHHSYGYEEFVEGIRPIEQDAAVVYKVVDGVLKRIVEKATSNAKASSSSARSAVSFDTLWHTLSDYSIRYPIEQRSEYGMPDRVISEGAKVGASIDTEQAEYVYTCSQKQAEKVWLVGQLKAPDQLNVKDVKEMAASLGAPPGASMSYPVMLYTKLWQHAQNMLSVVAKTTNNPENYVLIIDEINRANISKVLGELITLLEEDKRQGAANGLSVTLPYSGEKFELPSNLYIIGTMNTADRSIALLDTALRRRFDFEEMPPRPNLLIEAGERTQVDLPKVLETINERLEYVLDRDHLIGHAWLMKAKDRADLDNIMRRKIIPLVAEYFYDDWNKVRAVLGNSDAFIARTKLTTPAGLDLDYQEDRFRWVIQNKFPEDAYEQILTGVQNTNEEDEPTGEST